MNQPVDRHTLLEPFVGTFRADGGDHCTMQIRFRGAGG